MKSQADDFAVLTGRAKDLIGLATVATTIASVILNDKVLGPTKPSEVPMWWAAVAAIALASILLPGIYCLWPRIWYFSPDPDSIYKTVSADLSLSTDDLFASVANGLVRKDVVVSDRSALEWNDAGLRRFRVAVFIQVVGYVVLGCAAAVLAFQQID